MRTSQKARRTLPKKAGIVEIKTPGEGIFGSEKEVRGFDEMGVVDMGTAASG